MGNMSLFEYVGSRQPSGQVAVYQQVLPKFWATIGQPPIISPRDHLSQARAYPYRTGCVGHPTRRNHPQERIGEASSFLYFCAVPQTIDLTLRPEQLAQLPAEVAAKLGVSPDRVQAVQPLRRSLDARGRSPRFVLRVQAWVDEPFAPTQRPELPLRDVSQAPPVHIVGFGSAGLFAALELIVQGYKPVVIERGKAVRPRRRDLAALTKAGVVNPDSNYCFGEGGAGTFSDGKLYTRSTKRGDTRAVLDILVQFGATPDILVDAHPHIGTNKLPGIIQNMREAVIACGGEVHFETRVTGFDVQQGRLRALRINEGERWPVQAVILATGHSARDVFHQLPQDGIAVEAKPFALGLRVEHPQALIDRIQYNLRGERPAALPAAAYNLVQQVQSKGVYSFCMCPGGIICPAATANDEVVVNGWSPSKRNSPYANSGMVVELQLDDLGGDPDDPLRGLRFQAEIEQRAYRSAGGAQQAPALRLTDFVAGKVSQSLPPCSYLPGLTPVDLRAVLPDFIHGRLQQGFRAFGKKLKGYLTAEAVVVGVESRTSSPVRIPRDRYTFQHPQVAGLYPAGEGPGYAGGIMSAAIDGQRCVRAVLRSEFEMGNTTFGIRDS